MILDDNEYFKTVTTAVTTLGGSTSSASDYFDMEETGAMDGHRKKYLNIEGILDLTSDGADTVTITLESDTAVGFATNLTTHYTTGALAKDAIAALDKHVLLPEGMYRYFRIKWVVTAIGSKTASTGTFVAYISNS
jgi:hypothetical protein